MKSKTLTLLTAVVLFVALAIPAQVSAQEPRQQEEKKEHTRYKLVDLGTPGGPHGYGSVNGDGFRFLNDSGVVASSANTSAPDPNAPNSCYVLDCFLAHDFRWKDGKMTDLGALPSVNGSAAGSINARRWSTGQSENGLVDPLRPFGLLEQLRAVLWKQGKIIDLGTLGGIDAIGIDLNNRGQVVGFSTNAVPDATTGFGTPIRSFIWEKGVRHDLGTLGGLNTSLFGTIKINERGQVTGSSRSQTRFLMRLPACQQWTPSCGKTAR